MKTKICFEKMDVLKSVIVLSTAMFFAGNVAAATMKIVELPATGTDGAIDISTSKTYTHTFDFGLNDPVTINGVAFERAVKVLEIKGMEIFKETSSQGYGYSLEDTRWFLPKSTIRFWLKNNAGGNAINDYCDGESRGMFNDFLYFDKAQGLTREGIIVTLKDLKPATPYSVRYYYRSWDPPTPRPLIIYGDAESNGVFKDSIKVDINIGRLGAQYLDYSFTTDDKDVVLKFLFLNAAQGTHLYGLTCEQLPQSGVNTKGGTNLPANELWQSYSNSFNPNKNVHFRIHKREHIKISVHNLDGRQVAVLVDGIRDAGKHSANLNNPHIGPGVYVCKLTVSNNSLYRKIFLTN